MIIIFSLFSYHQVFASAPTQGLVGFWKFDEGLGSIVNDSISGNRGEIIGTAQWIYGKLGGALDFHADSKVRITSGSALNNLTSMTISVWVYTRPGARRIITKGTAPNARFYLSSPTAQPIGINIIEFGAGYDGKFGIWDTPAGSLSYNAWHQVSVTYTDGDPASVPNIYIDGVPQAVLTNSTPSGQPLADGPNLSFADNGNGGNYFDGSIDQFRIYNRILTPSEISSLYTADAKKMSPNIVVIMTDDQTDMGSMAVMPKTRNLIGAQGLTFTNSFVDFPLCCPSRASFLTGQAAHNNGVLANSPPNNGGYATFKPTQGNSLPVWLQQAGYTTAHMGKYLNGFTSAEGIPPGWTLWNGIADDQGGYSYYNYYINENGATTFYGHSAADYKTDVQADRAADFIKNQQYSSQPFFLWLAPLAPHANSPELNATGGAGANEPPVPALRHLGVYDTMSFPTPPNFNEADVSDKPGFVRLFPVMDQTVIASTKNYFRRSRESLLAVDDMVEKVMSALESAGKLDNTVVIFTSDNGYFTGEHRRPGDKSLVYEESIRVPLLIRGPNIPKGEKRSQLVNNLDVVATIEELAGVNPGRVPDGRSLSTIFTNRDGSWRTSLLIQGMDKVFGDNHLYGRFQAVRTKRYVYAEHNGSDFGLEREFYDLQNDPYELNSKPNDPAYASIIMDLSNRLATLRSCAGASCWSTAPDLTPSDISIMPSGSSLFQFQNNLSYGMNQPDIRELQKFFNTHGYPVASSGSGSSGNETMYFGGLTKAAVIRFQAAHALVPDGNVGPKTRAVLNQN